MKMKENPIKTIYYEDELNDEFSSAVIKAKKIDGEYKYIGKSFLWKIARFLIYRIIAFPIAYCYLKIALCWKCKNRKALKELKKIRKEQGRKIGCFLYGNHTHPCGDAFIPSMVMCPESVFAIVHPNNVSMPILGRVTPYLGAIPLPDNLKAARNFKEAIDTRIKEGCCITIYPEAHIWPYYTGIRNFKSESFNYPCNLNVPVFVMTTTYQKRKFGRKPKAVTYLDGPLFCNESLGKRQRSEDLRNRVYAVMKNRSLSSNCEYIKYEKKLESEDVI